MKQKQQQKYSSDIVLKINYIAIKIKKEGKSHCNYSYKRRNLK